MIQMILLTGFLGAGKTTLLQRILESFTDKRTGVVINEFGEVNVDGALVKKNGVALAELSNGSIFCACIKDKFLDSLIEMSKNDIDYLFIEASGLADPSSMEQILRAISKEVKREYDYRGACCLVDPETHMELSELLPALPRQIQYSSACIINKADLVPAELVEAVASQVSELNPQIIVYVASYCKVNVEELVAALKPPGKGPEETTNTEETRPKTFVLGCEGEVLFGELEAFVRELAPSAYRIKGFVPTEKGTVFVSAVGRRVKTAPAQGETAEAGLVVISSVGIRMMSLITKALPQFTQGKLKL